MTRTKPMSKTKSKPVNPISKTLKPANKITN